MENSRKIAVVGLGFVGLPLALSFSMNGAEVCGVDVNDQLICDIRNGITHHTETYQGKPIQKILNEELAAKRFRVTTSLAEAKADVYIVTVGMPVASECVRDNYLRNAILNIASLLKKGDVVIIRSTVVPGMTEEVLAPLLEEHSGLNVGKDFFLAYASERIAEGRAFEEFRHMPLVLSGYTSLGAQKAKEILSIVTKAPIHLASSMAVVETVKVMENVQRDVNIAMVQEFARFSEAMGIDTAELITLANTHERVQLLTPGAGVGGYCIPNAYYYLNEKAKRLNVSEQLSLLKQARLTNHAMPEYIVSIIDEEMVVCKGRKVAIFGLAMKDNSNDDRISPAVSIATSLSKRYDVAAYDPAITSDYPFLVDDPYEACVEADILVLLGKQPHFDMLDFSHIAKIMKRPALIDTKNYSSEWNLNQFTILWKI